MGFIEEQFFDTCKKPSHNLAPLYFIYIFQQTQLKF